jgi:hypothetical protein
VSADGLSGRFRIAPDMAERTLTLAVSAVASGGAMTSCARRRREGERSSAESTIGTHKSCGGSGICGGRRASQRVACLRRVDEFAARGDLTAQTRRRLCGLCRLIR